MTFVIIAPDFRQMSLPSQGARWRIVDIGNLLTWFETIIFAGSPAQRLGRRELGLPRFQHWEKEPWTWKRFWQLPVSFRILAVLSVAAILLIALLILVLLIFK
ncbi:hypothetical protein [Mesorhizobium australafricanum]|uniref:Uncharacterized protein n=1 Tax=Mesorhizobium australafricanum TaxID=3072311 RepID=A0ABU4X3R9_9HYPH|nr:hypothetical protein [Mesorhizobium sp. VK3E]MDX8442684.1 hypothetical protein [Mesorhizobium sp. VK3E]